MEPETGRGLRLGALLLLAHHPLCSAYGHDVFRIANTAICRGCVLSYPTCMAGFFLAAMAHPTENFLVLTGLGLTMGVPHLGTYIRRARPGFRAAAKLIGGFGLGMLLAAGWWADWSVATKIVMLGALGTCFVALQSLRARSIVQICRRCPWAMRWDDCPGFAGRDHTLGNAVG